MRHAEHSDDRTEDEAKALEDFHRKLHTPGLCGISPERSAQLLEQARSLQAKNLREIEEKMLRNLKIDYYVTEKECEALLAGLQPITEETRRFVEEVEREIREIVLRDAKME